MDRNVSIECLYFGINNFFKKNYLKAIQNFTLSIDSDSSYVRAYLCRAEAYEKLGKFNEAIADIQVAFHKNSNDIKLLAWLAALYKKLSKQNMAENILKKITEFTPTNLSFEQANLLLNYLKNYKQITENLSVELNNYPNASLWMKRAQIEMKQRNFEEAIILFTQSIDILKVQNLKEEISICYFGIGHCYIKLLNWMLASIAFLNAVQLFPKDTNYLLWYGLTLIKLVEDKAILVINQLLLIDPLLEQGYLLRACYYYQRNRLSKAILNCNEAIKCNNTLSYLYLFRALLKSKMKSNNFAVDDFNMACNLCPKSPFVIFNRAIFYEKLNIYDKALCDYDFSLNNCINNIELKSNILINRSLLHIKLKNYQFTMMDILNYLNYNHVDKNAILLLAYTQIKTGHKNEALETLNHCLVMDYNFAEAFILRGNINYESSLINDDAHLFLKDYERSVHLNPMKLVGWLNIAISLKRLNYFQKAWNILTKIITMKPNEAKAFELRGLVCMQMGNYLAALTDLNSALKICTTASTLINRSIIHKVMKDNVSAIKDLKMALDIDEDNRVIAYYNIALLYAKNHQFIQALDYLNQAIFNDPIHIKSIVNRAIIKAKLDKYNEFLYDIQLAESLGENIEKIQKEVALLHGKAKSQKGPIGYIYLHDY